MISEMYITEAVNIRNEFMDCQTKLLQLEQSNIKDAYAKINAEKIKLESLQNGGISKLDSNALKKTIEDSLDILDDETKRFANIIVPINTKIEELKSREMELYSKLQKSYPNLTDEQIIEYIKPHLK